MQLRTEAILEAFDGALDLIEDEAQRERFARVLAASRPAVEQAARDLVGQVVAEINDALGDDARVDLAYEPDGVAVSVTRAEPDDAAAEALAAISDEVEKLTLRLPSEVKEQATGAAAEAAMSLNTWIVRSVARALSREADRAREPGSGRRGRRGRRERRGGGTLRGWVGS